jgi:hypothetical protein
MAFSAAVQGQEFGIFRWQLAGMIHPPFGSVEMLNLPLVQAPHHHDQRTNTRTV